MSPNKVTNGGEPSKEYVYFDDLAKQVHQIDSDTSHANGNGTSQDEPQPVEEIESMCMNCHDNGITRLLLTKIPFFREVIIMSFACDHCGFHNNEIQAAGSVQQQGEYIELRLTDMADFARQVVKSDTAVIKFIEIDIEIPAGRGQLTNVEGVLSGVLDDLDAGQEYRLQDQPEVHAQLAEIITKGRAMLAGESFPFRVYIDDPAGNSWIAPDTRDGVGKWEKRNYTRTSEQNAALGLGDSTATNHESAAAAAATNTSGQNGVIPLQGQGRLDENDNIISNEVYTFPDSCPGCSHPCTTNMKMVDVPHFKQVIIMSTSCEACGYKSNEVKTGGEIPEKGKKITLKVRDPVDLARDILKAESCHLACPELSLDVNPGTLGGRFTTVEGLLTNVRDDLRNHIFQADGFHGPSSDASLLEDKERWDKFFEDVDEALEGKRAFTIVLTDPLAGSYVQSLAEDPSKPDGSMTVEEYERTDEEEEELGLKDIKVEGYEDDAKKERESKESEERKAGDADVVSQDQA